MLRIFTLLAVACCLSPQLASAQDDARSLEASAADGRYAYFSLQRAYLQSSTGKAAQAKLSSFQEEKSKELDALSQKLQQQIAALAQTASILSEDARQVREQEIARFEIDVKRFTEDAQAQFMGIQREVETAFLAQVRPALRDVATSRGLLLVFDEDAGVLAWADPLLDVTPDVVERLDRRE